MKTYGEPVVRLGFLNLEHDGGPDEEPGVLPAKWVKAHEEILVPREFDWLGRGEMTFSQTKPVDPDATEEEKVVAADAQRAADSRFRAAQDVLGMRGFRSPTGQGRNPTGLFLRESTFTFQARHQQLKIWRTPPTNVVMTLAEVPEVPIVTVAWHNSFCSPNGREDEAEELSSLVDKVQAKYLDDPEHNWAAFWGFGDCNEYPVPAGETVPEIDWTSPDIRDLVHRRHRARKQADGTWRSCTYLDEMMLDCGMHDPARFAAHQLGQIEALKATAGHASDGQGGGRRIDRGYMDPWLVQAVIEVNIFDTTGVSDHHGVEVILSRRKAVECLRRQREPLKPWLLDLAV
ncbi:endonuclease/exonuclease/phosphatase family protein [Actinacidiphila sp. ITFR-21]|uniref:endonuclease/exonuclease/phosphatase family protein n=1 Tax=Actinacidiphila sp. ITFR-21 TaxID=3075199 RepID=UPI00288BAB6B|nr:endonuclease/exonuclease/phosphatase family protein [Streptomyces sp. ITFR-21]WNI17662.1 endonuclease/exonuclease/phosphatase family protein [Streptomyces sp. ITFR-21]WNI17802.1 endonuclease/exonuclease/phosphatase family protein [Streptomyces sp. ITFR-21]